MVATVHYLSMNTGSGRLADPAGPEYGGVSVTYTADSLAPSLGHTINWGDGSGNTTATTDVNGGFTTTHTFALVGTYAVVVTETVSGRLVARETITAEVKPGTFTPPGTVTHGVAAAFTGTNFNPSTAYSIDWGDGTAASTGTTTAGGAITSTNHTYAAVAASRTATVTVASTTAATATFAVV